MATSQSNLTELDGQITTTRYQLGALLGKGRIAACSIANPIGESEEVALPDNVPADLVSRRPDLVAARWQVESATHDIKEAKAEFFPDINLAAAFGFDAFGWSKFLQAAAADPGGPGDPSADLRRRLSSLAVEGPLRRLRPRCANYNQTLINALNDVATQVAAIRSLDRQMGDAERALAAATSAYNLAVIRYKAGLSPQLQVSSADENRLSNEQTVTNLRMKRRDLQIGLIKALGGGFDATSTNLAIDGSGETHAAASAAPAALSHGANQEQSTTEQDRKRSHSMSDPQQTAAAPGPRRRRTRPSAAR